MVPGVFSLPNSSSSWETRKRKGNESQNKRKGREEWGSSSGSRSYEEWEGRRRRRGITRTTGGWKRRNHEKIDVCDEGREVRFAGERRREEKKTEGVCFPGKRKRERSRAFSLLLFSFFLHLSLSSSLSFLNSDPTGIRCHTRLVIQHEVSHDEKSRNEMMNLSG